MAAETVSPANRTSFRPRDHDEHQPEAEQPAGGGDAVEPEQRDRDDDHRLVDQILGATDLAGFEQGLAAATGA
ncbi:MAG: hypothetical protein R3C15_04345 [Thermoleophilia bacterium]